MGVLGNFERHKQLSNLHPLEDTWPLGFWGGQKRYPEGQGVNFDPPMLLAGVWGLSVPNFSSICSLVWPWKWSKQTNKQTENALY